ncbi:MAG: hypothetical protein KI790_09005 [Cyclobacteriaceae bacterium]|nr:hypothetical protein [Cyclobacteriaceae bacterium HetDA_MAG_MS6]
MAKRAVEKWKDIKFPHPYYPKARYQISNYGRVRNLLEDGSFRVKQFKILSNNVVFKFVFPANEEGIRLVWHQKASHLVARHFHKGYFKGCYVIWKNYNKYDNYIANLMCLEESPARSYLAKGRKLKVKPEFVFPAEEEKVVTEVGGSHRVETDISYYKQIPTFPHYEVNREGIIRKRVHPFKGRIIKQRKHPDGLFMMDLRDRKGARKTAYPHKLVAELWCINPDPDQFTEIVHMDGDSFNNNAENLQWASKSAALKHQFKIGKRDNRRSWKTRKKLYGNGFKNK